MVILEGLLYRQRMGMDGRRQTGRADLALAIPAKYREAFMLQFHDAKYGGGHFSYDKTLGK